MSGPFVADWFVPGEAAGAIGEGFCPLSVLLGAPAELNGERRCPACGWTWQLIPGGFQATWETGPGISRIVAAYPFSDMGQGIPGHPAVLRDIDVDILRERL